MVSNDDPFFDYAFASSVYLERARYELQRFDEGNVSSFFYAALELRFGIEARLNEYIEAALGARALPGHRVKGYSASRLLRILTNVEPLSAIDTSVEVMAEKGGESAAFEYTPVTKKLAEMHGRLGGLLHWKYFRDNKDWLIRERLVERGSRSMSDERVFLNDVAEELAEAVRGNLLNHPRFEAAVADIESGKDAI